MQYRDRLFTSKTVHAARIQKPGTLEFEDAQAKVLDVLTVGDMVLGHWDPDAACWHIKCLGGTMRAFPGEWILRDDNARPWPVTDASFHLNYTEEPADAPGV